ncbi:CDP-alcohol phosphatidyltransferase family protein [Reyranella sp. CPCC 100927]|uniref:CDP-alcohol phosphatidyltransferase family protein n=1 Tax=Reyranella sp. CPCC 100927 TaxID=2599616 RepID=UPI0011B63DA1|nr:CDP-alcohol phosphatidyltransferase family protein [Reyranella sp. CPCC 100927]TWT15986.1 CDP-alcohol phosphatidyltransferase family protein [Reyranella sp. CPCC 100927]
MTLYDLKPRFQALLRPLAGGLVRAGITANQVTLVAALGSIVVGVIVVLCAPARWPFLLLPIWLFLRMALNALDGMLAREFGQKSALGAYLNEICDVVSDAALYLPFAVIAPFTLPMAGLVVFLAALSEFAGVLGVMVGASRRYDGPMGKSDRALVFGALGLWIGIGGALPSWLAWLLPLVAALIALNIVNRVRRGLAETTS